MREQRMDGDKVRRIRPTQSADGTYSREESSGSRRRGRRIKPDVRTERKAQRLQLALIIVLSLTVVGILSAGLYVDSISDEGEILEKEVSRLDRELTTATTALERITSDRDMLVSDRIPGLSLVRYDETLQIGDQYVRNIVFTLAKKDDKPSYEYRVVFSNDGLSTVIPDLHIILFSEVGIQLGDAQVPSDDLSEDDLIFTLEPGEVRTHSGTIEYASSESPKYFFLQVN